MVKKSRPSKEDNECAIQILKEQINAHREGKISQIIEGNELAELLGVSKATLRKNVYSALSAEERHYHTRAVLSQVAQRNIKNGVGIHSLSTERRREIGTANYESGKGIGSLTKADRQKIGREAYNSGAGIASLSPAERKAIGTANYDAGKGIAALTTDQRKEIGKRNGIANSEKSANIYWRGENYHSATEAALADLFMGDDLEGRVGFIPNWKVQKGKTWQVKDGGMNNGGIDFLISTPEGNKFMEYHPPKTFKNKSGGDLRDGEEYKKFVEIKSRLAAKFDHQKVKRFERMVKHIISSRYIESRENAIANSSYKGTPLVYCASVEEVYSKVIFPYNPTLTQDDFLAIFRKKHREILSSRKHTAQLAA